MTRIALTGASGLVGLEVCRAATARGYAALGLVRNDDAAERVRRTGAETARVAGLAVPELARAFVGAQAVVHFAQIGKEEHGETFEAVNVGGTRAVIEAARQAGVRRIVYFSGLGVAHYGMTRHCTNAYFLSKLTCEVDLQRSGIESVVFRPSYIVGPGGHFLPRLVREIESGEVERVGDGEYRMQPIAVKDAAALVVAAIERPPGAQPSVFDLVGPEPITYNAFLARVAATAGRPATFRVREVPIEDAMRQARGPGYRGMRVDDLDCVLCDEVSEPRALEALLGRALTSLDDLLRAAL